MNDYNKLSKDYKAARETYRQALLDGDREKVDEAVKVMHNLEDKLKTIDKAVNKKT